MMDESAELLARVHAGDEDAAAAVFHRYLDGLIAMAATHLSHRLARRLDPEDVVQSAYRSFFTKARDGRYVLQRSGDLWRLLVGITLHKLQHQVQRHTAGKRALAKEQRATSSDDSEAGQVDLAVAREPTPLEAAALADEVESILRQFDADKRPILELRLQGHNQAEIADQLKCSERTVRRVLDQVKKILSQGDSPSPEAQT